jgi:hypothetical protein
MHATPGAPWLRRAQVTVLRQFQPAFRRIVAEESFVTTDGALGVLATGTLDSATLNSLLQQLPPGTWELITHPAYNDADLAHAGTRLLDSRQIELAALPTLHQFPAIRLISFADLRTGEEPPI